MSNDERSEKRLQEMDEILDRKPKTRAVPDEADRYRVLGAADRRTYANWLTSVEEHYVCHRNETLDPDPETWEVTVSGAVEREAALSMQEIQDDYPTVGVAHTMECAGNGRGYFDPETGSVQWGYGAVSNAFWTGTPLSSVLRAHDAATGDGMWVTAIGGDLPEDGTDRFARSLPMSKVLDDCLLAYEVNGRPLPPEHGLPVRLIVPGWYGVNSVKWLEEVHVMDKMVYGDAWENRSGYDYTAWQQDSYRIHPRGVDPAHHATLSTFDTAEQGDEIDHPYTFDQNVKSIVGHPDDGETIRLEDGDEIEVIGVAWAGDDAVTTVELSTDDGDSWDAGSFFGPSYAGAWRLFRYIWEPSPGSYTLLSRATDEEDRRQPARISKPDETGTDTYPWNEGGYAENAYRPHAVEVTVEPRDS